MKIITTTQQKEAFCHIDAIIDALTSQDKEKLIDCSERIGKLIYIVGGLKELENYTSTMRDKRTHENARERL